MRIALAQTNIIWEDKQANLVRAEEFVIAADAEVVLFPEMSLTGFQPTTGWTIEQIKTLADRHHTTIGIGWVKKTEPLCENHYSIVTPDGGVAMDFAKIHPFSYGEEHEHFQGGTTLCTGTLGEFRAGLGICYDLRFPEQFRAMVPKTEFFIVPANWPESRVSHWKALLNWQDSFMQ